MIDKNGKKILSAEQRFDPDFARKEIKFFMKGFLRETDDRKGYNIAKMVKEYIKNGGPRTLVKDYLIELEKYTEQSESDDFLWELVYIRRLYSDWNYDRKEYWGAGVDSYKAAKHFEEICRVRPSWHNQRCRVYEYCVAALYSMFDDYFHLAKETIVPALDRAAELFGELEVKDNEDYYNTGRLLYYCKQYYMRKCREDNGEEFLQCLRKLTYYGRELYRRDKRDATYLEWVTGYYETAVGYSGFSDDQELENVGTLCSWVQDVINEDKAYGVKLLKYLERLKRVKERIAARI